MQNKEINEIFVFQEDQQIVEQQNLQSQQKKIKKQSQSHRNNYNVQNTKQSKQHEDIYGMVSPSFQTGTNNNKLSTFLTSEVPPANQNQPRGPNLVFEQQNAYSFRKNDLNFQNKKQQFEINQLQIISDYNSQISNNEALIVQDSKKNIPNNNQIIRKNPSRRKFKDIHDQENVKSQKGLRRLQQFNEPQKVVPNMLNVQKQEQNNRTQDNLKIIQEDKFLKESTTMKRKRNIKIPPIQSEKSGQIYINTSNIISNESSMIVLNKKQEDLRFANASSLTKMEISQNQNVKTAIKALPQNKKLKCILKRSKQCFLNYCHPQYSFHFSSTKFIANAKKQSCYINSHYNITSSQKEFDKQNENYLGHLQGNFVGSCFNLYQLVDNQQELVCTVCYQSQFSCSISTRKMEIYIKSQKFPSSSLYKANNRANPNLKELYNLGENAQQKKIIKLVNKQPEWSQSLGCFYLNFRGKCKLASVKNMALIQQDNVEKYNLLFCKTEQNEFHTQMMYPLSPFIAMGIILSSFDFKICTQ